MQYWTFGIECFWPLNNGWMCVSVKNMLVVYNASKCWNRIAVKRFLHFGYCSGLETWSSQKIRSLRYLCVLIEGFHLFGKIGFIKHTLNTVKSKLCTSDKHNVGCCSNTWGEINPNMSAFGSVIDWFGDCMHPYLLTFYNFLKCYFMTSSNQIPIPSKHNAYSQHSLKSKNEIDFTLKLENAFCYPCLLNRLYISWELLHCFETIEIFVGTLHIQWNELLFLNFLKKFLMNS